MLRQNLVKKLFYVNNKKTKRTISTNIRNIGLIAHVDAGKTTTTERILYYAGYTKRLGNVDEGSTVTDYLPAERERGITIQSACIPLGWKEHQINLIDSPGHIDFNVEVERCIRVLDGAIVLLDGVAGVEAQTEVVWKQANNAKIPRILFINKMDRDGATVNRPFNDIKKRLRGWGIPALLHWPVVLDGTATKGGSGGKGFEGIVDLITMQRISFQGKDNTNVIKEDLTNSSSDPQMDNLYNDCLAAKTRLVETMCDVDDTVLDAFLSECDGDPLKLNPTLLQKAVRKATLSGDLVPVLMGASFRNIGVQPLLDSVVDYLPAPEEREPSTAVVSSAINRTNKKEQLVKVSMDDKRLFVLAFKIVHDQNRGPLVFVRVYSGVLKPRSVVVNTSQSCKKERAAKILQMYADDYEEVPELGPGDIGAIQGLKFTKTGDTLSDPHSVSLKNNIQLESIHIPPPVFFTAVEPASRAEEKKFEEGMGALIREDPSLYLTTDPTTQQTLLGGIGELHLEISLQRLKEIHKVNAKVGKVLIGYRETITSDSQVNETFVYDREVFGKSSWASVTVSVSENLPTYELEDVNKDFGDGNTISLESSDAFMPNVVHSSLEESDVESALRAGITTALSRGPFLGFPVCNVSVTVVDVLRHSSSPELTTAAAVRAAAHRATQLALQKSANVNPSSTFGKNGALLEPTMNVNISVPEKFVGVVTRDIGGGRRGQVINLASSADQEDGDSADYTQCNIESRIPLSSLLGYASNLRSMTQGTGSFNMSLSGFGVVGGDRSRLVEKEIRGF